MNITKFGHSCILFEKDAIQVLIDPGNWSMLPKDLKVDGVLITHEHPDHLDLNTLKVLKSSNPDLKIYTNQGVRNILSKSSIDSEIIANHGEVLIKSLSVKAYHGVHALVYPGITQVENTGYLIDNCLFHPGDSFIKITDRVDVLALPITAPWLTIEQSIDYAKQIKPKKAFPIHDGALKHFSPYHTLPQAILESSHIEFIILEPGITCSIV